MSVITLPTPRNRHLPVRVKRPSEKRSLSRSAARALDVLEFFGQERRPLRAVDIGRKLHLPPSSANQLLKTMVDSGHLVFQVKGKSYLPSPRLAGFGGWMVDTYGADERLRNLVRDLQYRAGLLITLTTPNDLFMQIIDWAAAPGQHTERGLQISIFGSAIGSAYLSTLDKDALVRLADRARVPVSQMPALLAAVASIERAGYADGPSLDGRIWSIAMPLPRHVTAIPMVLGLAGPHEQVRKNADELKREMLAAVSRWTVHEEAYR